MWAFSGSRRDLADLAGGKSVAATRRIELSELSRSTELHMLWFGETIGSKLPDVIVVNSAATKRDVLAWSHTYVPTLRPLTGFARVLTREELEAVPAAPAQVLTERFGHALTGIVIAETLCGGQEFAVDAALGTLSFAMLSGMYSGWGRGSIDPIGDAWLGTRLPAPERTHEETANELKPVWQAIADAAGRGADQQATLFMTANAARRDNAWGYAFIRTFLEGEWKNEEVIQIASTSTATREERLLLLNEFLRAHKSASKIERAITVGYLANAVAPGTFEHIGLIGELRAEYPGCLGWYGFFAGLTPRAAGSAEQALAIHIRKHLRLLGARLDVRHADISADEMLMLLPMERLKRLLAPGLRRVLVVELVPRVYSIVTIPNQIANADRGTEVTADPIKELGMALQQASAAYKRMTVVKRGSKKPSGQRKG